MGLLPEYLKHAQILAGLRMPEIVPEAVPSMGDIQKNKAAGVGRCLRGLVWRERASSVVALVEFFGPFAGVGV